MRMTRHNSRGSKHSKFGYSAKHNSRDFDLNKADNINPKKSSENLYWSIDNPEVYYEGTEKDNYKSFEQVEKEYYEKHFKEQYDELQARYKSNRQYKSMKSFDEWRTLKRYCPEETCLQFGNIDNQGKVNKAEAIQAMIEIMQAEMKYADEHNQCFEIIDFSIHLDEAVPHLQFRKVYKYIDNQGIERVGQNKSLEKAGLQLPNPDKPLGQYNNYKITLDKELRDMDITIAESHGFKIIKEPEVDVKHNMSKNKAIQEKTRKLKKNYLNKKKQSEKLTDEVNSLIEEKDGLESDIIEARKTLENAQKAKEDTYTLERTKKRLQSEIEALKSEKTTIIRGNQAEEEIQASKSFNKPDRELPDIQG